MNQVRPNGVVEPGTSGQRIGAADLRSRADTSLIEAVGILVTICADVSHELQSGRVETTDPAAAGRLGWLLRRLDVPTELVSIQSGGRRVFTVYRLHFAPLGAEHPLLRYLAAQDYLRDATADADQARALWRGVLLAQPLQKRRTPGIAVAVRASALGRVLTETAACHLGVRHAYRAPAPPACKVVVEDYQDAERLMAEAFAELPRLRPHRRTLDVSRHRRRALNSPPSQGVPA